MQTSTHPSYPRSFSLVAEIGPHGQRRLVPGDYTTGSDVCHDHLRLKDDLRVAEGGILQEWTCEGHVRFVRREKVVTNLYDDPDRSCRRVWSCPDEVEDVHYAPDGNQAIGSGGRPRWLREFPDVWTIAFHRVRVKPRTAEASSSGIVAVPYGNCPLRPEATPWNGREARQRLLEWATRAGRTDWRQYERGFACVRAGVEHIARREINETLRRVCRPISGRSSSALLDVLFKYACGARSCALPTSARHPRPRFVTSIPRRAIRRPTSSYPITTSATSVL